MTDRNPDVHCRQCCTHVYSYYCGDDDPHGDELCWCKACKKKYPKGYDIAQKKFLFDIYGGNVAKKI